MSSCPAKQAAPKPSHKAKPKSKSPTKASTSSSPTKRRQTRYGTPPSSSSSQSDSEDDHSDANISSASGSSGGSASASSSESEEEEDSDDDEPRRRGGGSAKVRKTQTKASVAAERRLAKKKVAQDKKIKSTIKRLRAPKARPLLDLVEGVSHLDVHLHRCLSRLTYPSAFRNCLKILTLGRCTFCTLERRPTRFPVEKSSTRTCLSRSRGSSRAEVEGASVSDLLQVLT